MSIKLTETQRLFIGTAAKRDDRCVVVPSGLKGGAAKIAAKLVAAGLVKEIRAKAEMAVWRRDGKTGVAYSLRLTATGVKTASIHEVTPSPKAPDEDNASTDVTAKNASPLDGSKAVPAFLEARKSTFKI